MENNDRLTSLYAFWQKNDVTKAIELRFWLEHLWMYLGMSQLAQHICFDQVIVYLDIYKAGMAEGIVAANIYVLDWRSGLNQNLSETK